MQLIPLVSLVIHDHVYLLLTMLHTKSPIINCYVIWMEAYFSARGMETRGIESPFSGIIIVTQKARG